MNLKLWGIGLLIASAVLTVVLCTGNVFAGGPRVYFATDSSAISSAEAENLLGDIVWISRTQDVVVLVGHADFRGGHIYNLYLAQRRARAVQTFLLEHGIASEQVEVAVSYGKESPVAPMDRIAEHMAENRSVDLLIIPRVVVVPIVPLPRVESAKEEHKNRIYGAGGFGSVGLESSQLTPSSAEVSLKYRPVFGVGYMRKVSNRFSLGVEGLSNRSGFLTIGYDL